MGFADELSEQLARLAESAGPAVVHVGSGWRGGSGIVIADGQLLTNAHNVRRDELRLSFADGRQETGRLLGIDLDGDLAVLAAETKGVPPLEWSEEPAGLGRVVFALAAGVSGPRLTFGTISGVAQHFRGPRGRPIRGGLEHTAPLAPGSSGSALLDGDGRLLGINTNRLESGFYVALPADDALRQRVAALQRGQRVERPLLGVGIAPAHAARRLRRAVGLPERDGVLVRAVEPESPAARAGIEEGDLIIEAGGRTVVNVDDLYDALTAHEQGSKLTLHLERGGQERTTEVDFSTDA